MIVKRTGILFFLIFTLQLLAQQGEKTIAIVGKDKITEREFRTKYELMPHVSKNGFSKDSVKKEFLYSLVAEKLWAAEARSKSVDLLPELNEIFEPLEKLYVKDALFKAEVESKVNITDKEILKMVKRKNTILKINAISSQNLLEINSIYDNLKKGASFDSILSTRQEFAGQEKPLEIKFGQPIEEVEEVLYSLDKNKFSEVVQTENGWFIFKVKDKIVSTAASNEDALREVKKILKERKTMKIGLAYLEKTLSNKKADVTAYGYQIFKDRFNSLYSKVLNPNEDFFVTERDILELEADLQDTLKMNFVNFENSSTTIKQFINYLKFTGFKVTKPTKEKVELHFQKVLNNYIEDELLYKEGIKKGLHNSNDVKAELKTWKDSYIAQYLKNEFLDSANVTDDEVQAYYNKLLNRKDSVAQVNIIEILTDKLEVVEQIFVELKQGKDFKELASLYSQREWTKPTKGEFGLFPVTMHGEIGKIASGLAVGSIYGPLKVSEGFSIFKVIDKAAPSKIEVSSFDEMKDQLKNDLRAKKLDDSFDSYTAKLADKYGVKIDAEALRSINTTDINMFTYRYMGFGGRVAATPYITPNYKWSEKLKVKENL